MHFSLLQLFVSLLSMQEPIEALPPQADPAVFLERGLEVQVQDRVHTFPAQSKDLELSVENGQFRLAWSEDYIQYVISTLEELENQDVQHISVDFSQPNSETQRLTTNGRLVDGLSINRENTRAAIERTLESGESHIEASYKITHAHINDFEDFQLLGTGQSNFANSSLGRAYNVRMALNDRIHGMWIPAGAEYSFNDFLGPVTYSAGWQGSYAIFGGVNLERVPGGGICQTSTTLYRAALEAGIEIREQRNHSLYIDYYAEHGDGLDATIFPGEQDLVLYNDTPNPIFIEAYTEGEDAFIHFYGIPDGRQVTLEGPYSGTNQPESLKEAYGQLTHRELAWYYRVDYADGTQKEDWLISSYLSAVPQYE